MLWQLKKSLYLNIIAFLLLGSFPAAAMEIIPLLTRQQYMALDGCCQSSSARWGGGGILRLSLEEVGTWDIYGMSDMKWNEVALLKPTYLIGTPVHFDPSMDPVTKVRRVPKYTVIWSYGAGLYTHNTRTTRFDLASLVTGFSFINHFEFQYALNDSFALVAVGRLGLGLSFDDRGLIVAPLFGFLWRL